MHYYFGGTPKLENGPSSVGLRVLSRLRTCSERTTGRNGYLFQLFLVSAHAVQCANLKVAVQYSTRLCFTGLCCALRALASSVCGPWTDTDNGSPREFDPIGHISTSTLDLLRVWALKLLLWNASLMPQTIGEGKSGSRVDGRADSIFPLDDAANRQHGSRTDLKSLWRCLSTAAIDLLPPSVSERSHTFFCSFV